MRDGGKVVQYRSARCGGGCRDETPEELTVSVCESSRAIHANLILVILFNLHDYSSAVPLVRVVAGLVL